MADRNSKVDRIDLEHKFYDIGYISDVGNKRKINQDRLFCEQRGDIAILAIADGMGGMQSGEQASEIAINAISIWWSENCNNTFLYKDDSIEKNISNLIDNINTNVISFCLSNNIKSGTTLTLVLITRERVFYAYSGDTRFYVVRNKKAELLSHDENLYSYMEQMKEMNNPVKNKNVLLSYIGKSKNLALNFNIRGVEKDDIFVICSDGVYNYYDFDMIENLSIVYNNDAQSAAEFVKKRVKNDKATDNLSLIILKCR